MPIRHGVAAVTSVYTCYRIANLTSSASYRSSCKKRMPFFLKLHQCSI